MKKFLLLAFLAILGTSAYAADIVQFVDADGNDVSGKTVEAVVESHDDGFGTIENVAYSNLSVKNVSGSVQYVDVATTITEISNGYHQICFGSCTPAQTAPGEYAGMGAQTMKIDAVQGIMSEWFPAEGATTGQCVITYQAKIYDATIENPAIPIPTFKFKENGPSVTVIYTFTPTGGVNNLEAGKNVASVRYYNICGSEVSNPATGLYIKRIVYTDGSVKTEKLHIN